MPENTVNVARPSRWGNAWRVGDIEANGRASARQCVDYYAQFMRDNPEVAALARAELCGKNLACWCALDQPCHADELLRFANA